jgi:hypothetical protein
MTSSCLLSSVGKSSFKFIPSNTDFVITDFSFENVVVIKICHAQKSFDIIIV